MRVSTTNFQNSFGKHLKHVLNDGEVIVTKNGKGVAKLVKYSDPLIHYIKESSSQYYISKYVTYSDYLALSNESDSRFELIDGEIFLLASPKHKHQVAVREISGQMYNYFSGQSCSSFTAPYDVKLFNDAATFEDDPNVVQPDIFVMCDINSVDENGTYQGKPTLIVEVLSKSTRSKDMIQKLNLYMMSNIPEYWIVDPDNKNIFVYVVKDREIEKVVSYKFGELVTSIVFTGLSINTVNM